MGARFGFCTTSDGRRGPTVNEYETISLVRRKGAWGDLSAKEQAQAMAYLEGPLGTLICALTDAMHSADSLGIAMTTSVVAAALADAKERLAKVTP